MAESATVTVSVVVNSSSEGGGAHSTTITKTANSIERTGPSIPAAKTGTLTTRTDDNTGTFTMTAGHGFATSDEIDVFWPASNPTSTRRKMTATVTGNSVVLDGGSGDALPAQATAITAMKPVEVPFTVDGDEVVVLAASSPKLGWIVFVDDADAEIAAATFEVASGTSARWCEELGTTNPLAGSITSLVKFSHGDSTAARTMRAVTIHD